jgi:hypothetical protein
MQPLPVLCHSCASSKKAPEGGCLNPPERSHTHMQTKTSKQETWLFDHPYAIVHTVRAPRFYLTIVSVSPT